MSKIPFKVSARTARLIGRENVSNAEGAIIELVKNGHDADAKGVMVLFDGKDDLYIVDNGHGMTSQVIQDVWMVIGTDSKEIEPYSPKKRIKSGAKGIGRFALDRLGQKVVMHTLPKGSKNGFSWKIDWSAFEEESTVLSQVKADFEEVKNLNLEDHLPQIQENNPNSKYNFFPQSGTILHISSLRDNWTDESIQDLFQNLESLVPILEKDSFSIKLLSTEYPDKFGYVQPLINDDFDYRVTAKYDSKKKIFNTTLVRNEFDVVSLEKDFAQVFNSSLMSEFPFDLKTFKKGSFDKKYNVDELLNGFIDKKMLLEGVGDFTFVITFAKNRAPNREDLRRYPYKSFDYKSRGNWLEKFSGVKIFRDNFRVRPYGENGDDWLQLGERAAKSPQGPGQRLGSYRLRPNQVAGNVYISRIANHLFDDKSSREGIQENESFEVFKNLLVGVISIIEDDRNRVFYSLSELYKQIDEKQRAKEAARSVVSHIKQGGSYSSEEEKEEATSKLVDAFNFLEDELKDQREEIQILRSLASAGLITAAVAHELRGLENILTTRNRDLRNLIQPFISEKDVSDIKAALNPYILLSEMEQTDKSINEWLNYALMPLKRDKRKQKTIFLKDYFEQVGKTWQNLLEERKIKFSVEGMDESFNVKMFTIDLDTVFNNLIINSVESFSRKKNADERKVSISCELHEDKFVIKYTDNGAGLDKSFEKNPGSIFLPQITSKRDSSGNIIGTGMGMYLVKSVVEDNGGEVKLGNTKSGFSIVISFVNKK